MDTISTADGLKDDATKRISMFVRRLLRRLNRLLNSGVKPSTSLSGVPTTPPERFLHLIEEVKGRVNVVETTFKTGPSRSSFWSQADSCSFLLVFFLVKPR